MADVTVSEEVLREKEVGLGVAQSGRSNGEVNSQYPARCSSPWPVRRHARAHSRETAVWEGRSCSEAPLYLSRESLVEEVRTAVAWCWVTCELCAVQGRALTKEDLSSCGPGSDQNVCSNFVLGWSTCWFKKQRSLSRKSRQPLGCG